MLTGRPPFQSSTQDEIYRKAKEREYDWPKLDTSENSICQEAKDLVAALLQSPEDRPDPDTIVQHPFFSCGWVPQEEEMSPKLRDSAPTPNQFLTQGLRGGRTALYARNLKKLCVKSEVGPFSKPQKISSTYREVAAEEKAGLTPAVPLPEGVVYRPFDQWLQEQVQRRNEELAHRSEPSALPEPEASQFSQASIRPMSAISRPGQQSFAAQQRAQNQPAPTSTASLTQRPRVDQGSSRSNRYASNSEENTNGRLGGSSIPTRQGRSQANPIENRLPAGADTVAARIGADLVQQLNECNMDKGTQQEGRLNSPKQPLSLFSPREKSEFLPGSKPDEILANLQSFHAELERALNSRSIGSAKRDPPPNPTIVVKWVDYTNKFGLGYILNNGSVGCIFKSSVAPSSSGTGRLPPTCVIVRNAETHLQNRGKESYVDRHQLVPISGPPVEFYENKQKLGMYKVNVDPKKFRVTGGTGGEPGKLSRGKSEYDDRKSEKIVLWNKFAKYMTAFGRDQDYPTDEALQRAPQESGEGTVVTFYQRFGDVGCWGFSDGSFQVCTTLLLVISSTLFILTHLL
jgi:hypothetical protein